MRANAPHAGVMGPMTTSRDPQTPPVPPAAGALMTVRTALILLASVVLGAVAGALAFLSGAQPAGAVLAGLAGAGASVSALHALIQ